MKSQRKNFFLVLFLLVTFGLIQVYSSSYIFAVDKYGDGLVFFRKQLFFVFVGLGVLIFLVKTPQIWLLRWGWIFWALAVLGLLLTFVPGIGVKVGGAQRWIPLAFGFRFEPCELMKVSLPFICARFVSQSDHAWGRWTWAFAHIDCPGPHCVVVVSTGYGFFHHLFDGSWNPSFCLWSALALCFCRFGDGSSWFLFFGDECSLS